MVTTVNEHYVRHLGPIYVWTVGELDAAFARSDAQFEDVSLPSKAGSTAVDHLPSHSAVASLFENVAASLDRGGLFVASFRDYDSAPLQGDARFILVRSDGERILTCFLEYGDTTVTVHDLLHYREGTSWSLRASSYPKLRLSPRWVEEQLSSLGLSVVRDALPGGMVRIVARVPASAAR